MPRPLARWRRGSRGLPTRAADCTRLLVTLAPRRCTRSGSSASVGAMYRSLRLIGFACGGYHTCPTVAKRWLFAPWSHGPRWFTRGTESLAARPPPNNQKEGPSPLGHTAPGGFTPPERQFGSLDRSPNNQKDGSLPLGHTAPAGSPVGPKVWQRESLPPNNQKEGLLPLGHIAQQQAAVKHRIAATHRHTVRTTPRFVEHAPPNCGLGGG